MYSKLMDKSRRIEEDSFSLRWGVSKDHRFMVAHGQKVFWSEIAGLSKSKSIANALRCTYQQVAGGDLLGKRPDGFDAFWDAVEKDETLVPPVEGNISPLLLPDIAWLMRESNCAEIVLEGGTRLNEVGLYSWWQSEEYENVGGKAAEGPSLGSLSYFRGSENKWAITTEFEGLHTFILGPNKLISRLVNERKLEGFWWQHRTERYFFDWVVHDSDVYEHGLVIWPQ